VQQPLVGQGLLIIEASRSQTHHTRLYVWSVRRRDLYLTTHNIHKRETSMFQAGFEPAIPASERPQTHALDRNHRCLEASSLTIRVQRLRSHAHLFKYVNFNIRLAFAWRYWRRDKTGNHNNNSFYSPDSNSGRPDHYTTKLSATVQNVLSLSHLTMMHYLSNSYSNKLHGY
jgi:hypothetical protein